MTTSPATRRLVLSTALAGMLTVALVACSGSAAPTSTANAVDPATAAPNGADAAAPGASTDPADTGGDADPVCALVTKDEVATAVGYPIATVTGAGGTCIFQATD